MFSGQLLNPNIALDFIKKEKELEYRQACRRAMVRQAKEAARPGHTGHEACGFPRKTT